MLLNYYSLITYLTDICTHKHLIIILIRVRAINIKHLLQGHFMRIDVQIGIGILTPSLPMTSSEGVKIADAVNIVLRLG